MGKKKHECCDHIYESYCPCCIGDCENGEAIVE